MSKRFFLPIGDPVGGVTFYASVEATSIRDALAKLPGGDFCGALRDVGAIDLLETEAEDGFHALVQQGDRIAEEVFDLSAPEVFKQPAEPLRSTFGLAEDTDAGFTC